MASSYDVFLVLNPFWDNVREFQILLRPLSDLETHYLAGAEGFYCPELDTALACLRFAERANKRLGPELIHLFAGRSGLPMIVPAKLTPEQRRFFFLEHLTRYDTYVQHYPARGETVPLVERVVVNLCEHVAALPRRRAATFFDVMSELPIHQKWRRRRLGSVG